MMPMSCSVALVVLCLATPTVAVIFKGEAVSQTRDGLRSEVLTTGLESFVAKPQLVLERLGSNVASFHAGVRETSESGSKKIQSQKTEYETKLAAQLVEIHKAEYANAQIALRIEDVRRSNKASEATARQVQLNCSLIVNDIAALKDNISYASEFVAGALNYTEQAISNAQEVSIIEVLASVDQHEKEMAEHHRRLQEVSLKKQASLMQTTVETARRVDPLTIDAIHGLMDSLGELRQIQNRTLVELKASFDSDFQIGAKKHGELLVAQSELNTTLASEQSLQVRLDAAVKHLHETQERLLQQRSNIRLFSQRFSTHMLSQGAENPGTPTPKESNWLSSIRNSFRHADATDVGNHSTPEVKAEEVKSKLAVSSKMARTSGKRSKKFASKKHAMKFLQ